MIDATNDNGHVTEVSVPVAATNQGAIPTSDSRNLVDDVLDAVGHQALVDRIIARWQQHCEEEDRRAAAFARLLDALRESDGADTEVSA